MRCEPSDPASRGGGPFSRRLVAGALAALAVAACGRAPVAEAPTVQAASAGPTSSMPGAVPHGDHNPHHGGVVMMKGDNLHYEVVLDPAGRAHRVYFTDAVREELPAAVASDVVLIVRRPRAADERIALQIDDAGESWVAAGRPVTAPAATSVRLGFTIDHDPYWIDLPFTTTSK